MTLLTKAQFAQYTRFGIKRGMPDILIFWGQVYGVELKSRRGQLSKTRIVRTRRGSPRELIGQAEMHEKLLDSGAFAAIVVVRSVDELCKWLDEWGVPRRGGRQWLAVLNARPPAGISARPAPAGGDSAEPA